MNGFPSFSLAGQVALITGAARGLGRAIALAFAHAGANVALGMRDVTTGNDLVRELATLGQKAIRLQMDVSDPQQISRPIQKTGEHFGKLDILVNNAGGGSSGLALNVTEQI